MEKTVDYRNVYIHFTKPLLDGGSEYTEEEKSEREASGFRQIHKLSEKGEEQWDFARMNGREY